MMLKLSWKRPLKELKRAIMLNKNIIVVYETDANKGKGSSKVHSHRELR